MFNFEYKSQEIINYCQYYVILKFYYESSSNEKFKQMIELLNQIVLKCEIDIDIKTYETEYFTNFKKTNVETIKCLPNIFANINHIANETTTH